VAHDWIFVWQPTTDGLIQVTAHKPRFSWDILRFTPCSMALHQSGVFIAVWSLNPLIR